ncbi:MAG: hypothetical protein COA33_015125 [Fluviicola sp.]|nr:hypothetical protein [Fluviicola sp.]
MKSAELLGLALLVLVSACGNLKENSKARKYPSSKIIQSLDSLGYFNLTPNEELDSLKSDIIKTYESSGLFEGKRFYDSIRYVDFRFYWLDSEKLFEGGGLISYLHEIKPTFDKLNLNLDFKSDSTQMNKSKFVHTIVINECTYYAFNEEINYSSWGIATYNFAKIINDVFEKQNSNERVYLISGGNDGRMVILTDEIYSYLKSVYQIDDEFPLKIDEWADKNQVPI